MNFLRSNDQLHDERKETVSNYQLFQLWEQIVWNI